jgi:ubiquitin carboxyl-terminal hydrolase 9/13
VLQALYFCSPFRDLVIQSTDISAPPVPAPVPRQTNPPLLTANSVIPRRKSERGKATPDVPSAPAAPPLVIPSAPPTLFSALRSLYVYISKNPTDKGVVAPRAFIDKLRDGNEHFRGVMHQDAHEFLNYLLNKIVEEIQFDKHHKDKERDASSDASGEDCE